MLSIQLPQTTTLCTLLYIVVVIINNCTPANIYVFLCAQFKQ